MPTGAGAPIKALSHTVADGAASTDEVVVFDTFSCLITDPDGTAPDCVDDTDPDKRLVTAGTDLFATDRVTALAVNDEKYVGVGAEPHEGLVNKFPFEVEQKTYPFWDGVVGRAVDATFQGEEEIDGLPTYKFQVIPRRRAGRDQQRHLRHLLGRQDDVDRPGHRVDHRPDREADAASSTAAPPCSTSR